MIDLFFYLLIINFIRDANYSLFSTRYNTLENTLMLFHIASLCLATPTGTLLLKRKGKLYFATNCKIYLSPLFLDRQGLRLNGVLFLSTQMLVASALQTPSGVSFGEAFAYIHAMRISAFHA